MDIIIIAHFCDGLIENTNNRFDYLYRLLKEESMDIELITSNFSHRDKTHRKCEKMNEATFIKEPGYKKNVSLLRFYSHFIMGKNLKKYLKDRKKPDIIYCAVPSLDVAYVATQYAKENNIKLIIDIQDLWPEAFKMIFNIPILGPVIYYPMNIRANKIYKGADEIVAVSQTYVDRALSVNKKIKAGLSVFLGTELVYFDELLKMNKIKKSQDEFWLVYIGTLGHNYDIQIVMEALSELKSQNFYDIKFMVLGDGPLKNEFEEVALRLKIDAKFIGRLEYKEMVAYLAESDIAINPIKKGAAGSIINKVGDYAAAGLPVINTQECKEYRQLIQEYGAGINVDNKEELVDAIRKLYLEKNLRISMGNNNRKLAEDKFDRAKSYREILAVIERKV